MPIDRRIIETNLLRKGFQKAAGDHRYYHFYFEGKATSIFTPISRGSHYKSYDDSLLGEIKKQLKMHTMSQLKDLLLCPMDYETYCNHLVENGYVKP